MSDSERTALSAAAALSILGIVLGITYVPPALWVGASIGGCAVQFLLIRQAFLSALRASRRQQ